MFEYLNACFWLHSDNKIVVIENLGAIETPPRPHRREVWGGVSKGCDRRTGGKGREREEASEAEAAEAVRSVRWHRLRCGERSLSSDKIFVSVKREIRKW